MCDLCYWTEALETIQDIKDEGVVAKWAKRTLDALYNEIDARKHISPKQGERLQMFMMYREGKYERRRSDR